MFNLIAHLAQELNLKPQQIDNALALLQEGATVPFIARYRKERTGEMDEVQLRQLQERHQYLTELEDRKQTILKAIADQKKLTPELEAKIQACWQKNELEDLYLPYRPKRRTRATAAREKGLEPLAQWIAAQNNPQVQQADLDQAATPYLNPDQKVTTVAEALQGAADILAEGIAEQAELRAQVRQYLLDSGQFVAQIKPDFPEGSTKFELYRNYHIALTKIAPHNLLALLRGQREGIVQVELAFEETQVLADLEQRIIGAAAPNLRDFYRTLIRDAFNRLIKTSSINAVIAEKKTWADEASIETFEANLRDLLLAAPAGMKPTLAIDPGFRTGCKVAVIDQTGKFLTYQAVFPHQAQAQRQKAAQTLQALIRQHKIELIAIGNGTASRETEAFVAEVLAELSSDPKPVKVMVNEAGASIYSASDTAIAEFPDLDVTVRGAISIGRRLQDPLAELVKLDPKSIGVGQYQHDVDQKRLKQKLAETVESCVNYVGVDLNTASKELLTYVSGITPTIAQNIVNFRNEQGQFDQRRKLLKVAKLGPKAFEQAAGFLRIREGKNPLDNTGVHPERYGLVEQILGGLGVDLKAKDSLKSLDLSRVNLKQYVTDNVGEPTLRDILQELEKPGRDPRAQFTYAQFRDDIQEITDLQVGMTLEGIITNVANFGAFVDIGVHQDGLVHISQLADYFVRDPKQVVKVGQVVKVRVMEVNPELKRIGLSMKCEGGDHRCPSDPTKPQGKASAQPNQKPSKKPKTKPTKAKAQSPQSQSDSANPSLEALQAKFNRRV
jgi:uncharacterized protein